MRRCSSRCGFQPSVASTTNTHASTAPTPASMFLMKRTWPGTSTKRNAAARRQRRPREAEIDRETAPLLLFEAVRVHARERMDEGRLAVVDVSSRGDHVHGRTLVSGVGLGRRPPVCHGRRVGTLVSRHGSTCRPPMSMPQRASTARSFGWDADGPVFRLRGSEVAGVGPSRDAAWTTYVTVESIAAVTDAVARAGGSVCERGLFEDSCGAAFGVRAAGGAAVVNEPGALCWNELNTSDPKEAVEFYDAVFGWAVHHDDSSDQVPYAEFLLDGRTIGGMTEWRHDTPAALVDVLRGARLRHDRGGCGRRRRRHARRADGRRARAVRDPPRPSGRGVRRHRASCVRAAAHDLIVARVDRAEVEHRAAVVDAGDRPAARGRAARPCGRRRARRRPTGSRRRAACRRR